MEFLKKHYEKILLSVVLLGLGAVAYWHPLAVRNADSTAKFNADAPTSKKASLPPLPLTNVLTALAAMTNPATVNFSGNHRVISPLTWKKMPDGSVKSFIKEGPDALVIRSAPRPIFATLTFERAGAGTYCVARQQPGKSRVSDCLKVGEKSKSGAFVLREVKGSGDEATEVVVELPDTQEPVTLVKSQPKQIVDSYAVDLRYEPDNQPFLNKRVGDSISFAESAYTIVFVGSNEVRITDQTGKQTPIKLTGAP
jgi:hypothetical protein